MYSFIIQNIKIFFVCVSYHKNFWNIGTACQVKRSKCKRFHNANFNRTASLGSTPLYVSAFTKIL